MPSFYSTKRPLKALITVLNTPETFRLAKRILLGAIVADIIILPLLFFRLSATLKIAPAIASTTNTGQVIVGPATTLFMQQLRDNNFVPIVFKKITRRPLSGDGSLITMNGDNIQVFEYKNHDSAMNDASLLADKYAKGSQKLVWKKNMHVYVNDKLVVFYLGKQDRITTTLDQTSVAFLTQPAQPSSTLSIK